MNRPLWGVATKGTIPLYCNQSHNGNYVKDNKKSKKLNKIGISTTINQNKNIFQ